MSAGYSSHLCIYTLYTPASVPLLCLAFVPVVGIFLTRIVMTLVLGV